MKRILTLLFVLFLFVGTLSIQSCKKCTTCTYTYQIFGQTETYSYPELCGSKSEINNYKDACAAAASNVSASCTCIDN